MIGTIYKVYGIGTDLIYIGSTTRTLDDRYDEHKNDYKARTCSSKHVFDAAGIENCRIRPIEEYKCDSTYELLRREGEYQKIAKSINDNCVNQNIAGRTDAEWYQDNKPQRLEQMKQWYQDNKPQKLQQQKQYDDAHKEQRKARASQPITCPCRTEPFRRDGKSKHEQTDKHKAWLCAQAQQPKN